MPTDVTGLAVALAAAARARANQLSRDLQAASRRIDAAGAKLTDARRAYAKAAAEYRDLYQGRPAAVDRRRAHRRRRQTATPTHGPNQSCTPDLGHRCPLSCPQLAHGAVSRPRAAAMLTKDLL